ncbi:hypothetical protein DV451_000635 [Geotrichum candidum]|uniref:Protein arginine methyltransferase NDUFAF7 n=1 Tax=Geotrichum candidum TaxID=1173061 RepID=A0A9P5GAG3_GEOCN|nr:hypothetical protein DV451_000635 [Geotrichum candidum]KAF5109315.1 hypothetical protein DV453_001739 [Geotrichum candidum]
MMLSFLHQQTLRSGSLQPARRSMSLLRKLKENAMQDPHDEDKNMKSFKHNYSVNPDTYSYTTDLNRENFDRFPLVTASRLAKRTERPRNVRMTSKEFIDDSLYHPVYGYFTKEVEIFTPKKPFSYNEIKDEEEFMTKWTEEYKRYETTSAKKLPQTRAQKSTSKASRQLWHTPTELFKPYYGEALARYLLVNYKLSLYPYCDLTIYEMGGGNGTLMLNILDYIRDTQPDVYARTKYRIIEISSNLASKQQNNLKSLASSRGHLSKVEIINKSIFDWDQQVLEPCFFIALEVFDNFSHDVIRYDNNTLQPYQGNVVIDGNGDFQEIFSPDLDPWARKFLQLREEIGGPVANWKLGFHPLAQPKLLRTLKNTLYPFRGNLSDPEYIPTRYLEFLHVLKDKFPEHRLLTSDFTHLPDTSPGYNSPVVQTVLDDIMVPVPSYMVLQGFFDILFPTDFELAAELYRVVCNKLIKTDTHHDFLEQWAELESTMTKKGENPMLSFYQNAAFMYS